MSKKEQRKQRRSPQPTTPPEDATNLEIITQTIPRTLILDMPPPIRLLICSIGNPAPYLNTLHSAGRTIVSALQTQLSYPAFTKMRGAYGGGLLSQGERFTLWQSPELMNNSGGSVSQAWKAFQKDTPGGPGEKRLVVIHDELELPLGMLGVKNGRGSAKGHNGLKSIKARLGGADTEWWRIGVGIGRPESREPAVVADYVLRKMGARERERIVGCVGRVVSELERLGRG